MHPLMEFIVHTRHSFANNLRVQTDILFSRTTRFQKGIKKANKTLKTVVCRVRGPTDEQALINPSDN